MGKKRPASIGKAGNIADKYVRLHIWLMRSAAYQSLPVGARALLVELYALFNGSNNGDLYLSAREAGKRLSVGKATAYRWFTALEDRGFIRARQRGAFTLKVRHATTWILAEFAFAGQLPTKAFMRWQPRENSEHGFAGGTDGSAGGTEARPGVAKNPSTVSLVEPSGPGSINDGSAGGTQLVYHGGGNGERGPQGQARPEPPPRLLALPRLASATGKAQ